MKTFFNIVFTILIALFVLVAILLLLSTFKFSFFPLEARSVLTGSMEPAITTGSVVFLYPQSEYGEGDIVTFKPDGNDETISITHRIVGVTTDEVSGMVFTTKGDANESVDRDVVYVSDVYGKVIFHIPLLGRLLDLAKTPWGFAALILIPALLVIVDEVKKIRHEMNKAAVEKSSDV